jgi:hypothetical protein
METLFGKRFKEESALSWLKKAFYFLIDERTARILTGSKGLVK